MNSPIKASNDIFIGTGTPKLDASPFVPEGHYEVQYCGHDKPVQVFRNDEIRQFVHWRIVTMGPYFEMELFQSFKWYKKYGYRSKFYRNWTIANLGRRPSKITRMSMRVFEGKIFKAYVRTAESEYQDGPLKGQKLPVGMLYSVVDELLEVISG